MPQQMPNKHESLNYDISEHVLRKSPAQVIFARNLKQVILAQVSHDTPES